MNDLPSAFVYTPRNYTRLINRVLRDGVNVDIKGTMTKELQNATIVVRNPRDRLVTDSGRRVNLGFAIAEWLSLMTGEADVSYFESFIKGYRKFSSSNKTIVGAYGPRVAPNQIEQVIDKLREDSSSRQAVVTIYDGRQDLAADSRDIPCTLSFQFLIRSKKLSMTVTMRSSDAVWGLTFDVFQFTMLQEFVATSLGVEMGDFILQTGSLHMYERHFGLTDELVGDVYDKSIMAPMEVASWAQVNKVKALVKSIWLPEDMWWMAFDGGTPLDNYYANLAIAARCSFCANNERQDESYDEYRKVTDPLLRRVLRPTLVARGVLA